jgi:hypothetical protein
MIMQILRQLQNIPVGNVGVSNNHGTVRVESDLSLELDNEEWLQHLSAKCLAKCLDICNATSSIMLDARVTRAKLIFHATAAPEPLSTASSEGAVPLWCVSEGSREQLSLGGKVVLTEEGERVLLTVFEQDGEFNVDVDKVIKSILTVMLDSNHELCDKSISVLRRRYGGMILIFGGVNLFSFLCVWWLLCFIYLQNT